MNEDNIHVEDGEKFDEYVRNALVGRKIVSTKISEDRRNGELVLDDGSVLEIESCYDESPNYDGHTLDALNTVDNAIMSVSVKTTHEGIVRERGEQVPLYSEFDQTVEIFVYTEGMVSNGQLVASVSGDYNPWYGTGFFVEVKMPS